MLRCWDLRRRKGLFIRLPGKEMGEQVSDPPPKAGAQGMYAIIELGGPRCGEHGKR